MEGFGGRSTADMLAEIESSSAAEVMMAVRYTTNPPGATFIPPLDDIICESRPHPGGSSLQRGDLVEITGPASSGKTTLITFLLMTSLLPSSFEIPLPPPILPDSQPISVQLGGKSQNAVLLRPTPQRCPIPNLVKSIQAHIRQCVLDSLTQHLRPRIISPQIQASIDSCTTAALSNLRIIRHKPRWKSLMLSLLSVLRRGPETAGLDLLVCDGFSDAYWPERWTTEQKGGRRTGSAKNSIRSGDEIGMKDVLDVVVNIRKEFGAVVVLSTQFINTNPMVAYPAPHLEAPFPFPFNPDPHGFFHHPLNIQISLTGRIRPLQSPADVTLVDALRGLEVQSSDQGARYEGVVRIPGGKGLAGTIGGERFGFAIGSSGLEPYTS